VELSQLRAQDKEHEEERVRVQDELNQVETVLREAKADRSESQRNIRFTDAVTKMKSQMKVEDVLCPFPAIPSERLIQPAVLGCLRQTHGPL
jgi:hypothetical protein